MLLHWFNLSAEAKLLVSFVASALVTWLLLYPLVVAFRRLRIMDQPGHRSSHSIPTPRAGGIGILVGALGGVCLVADFSSPGALLVGIGLGMAVAVVSLVDDIRSLPSVPRFMVHVLAATGVVYLVRLRIFDVGLPFVHFHMPVEFAVMLAVLFTVAFLNFFNFMDGINGLAPAQGLIGGLTMAVLLLMGGGNRSIWIAAGLAGGCLGFLPHNFPKARTFMGDIGSATIGFSLAILTFIGARHTKVPWIAFVLPLAVFLYDATFTLIKRLGRREPFWKPHREHHYQLLVRAGWSHTKVTLLNAAMMAVCAGCAILYAITDSLPRLLILVGLAAMLAAYSILVYHVFKASQVSARGEHHPGQNAGEKGQA